MKFSTFSVSVISALIIATEAREFVVGKDSFILRTDDVSKFELEKRMPRERLISIDDFKVSPDDSLDIHFEKRSRHHSGRHHRCKHGQKSQHHSNAGTSSSIAEKVSYTIEHLKDLVWNTLFNFHSSQQPKDSLVMQDGTVTDITEENPAHGEAPKGGPTLLRTALTVHPEIYNFVSYIRDSDLFAGRFNNENDYSIVFAPTDTALNQLDKKPWEFPVTVDGTTEKANEKIIRYNIANFISSHVSRESKLTVGTHVKSFNGVVITLAESKDKKQAVLAIDHEGRSIVADVVAHYMTGNGEIYVIDNCLIKP